MSEIPKSIEVLFESDWLLVAIFPSPGFELLDFSSRQVVYVV